MTDRREEIARARVAKLTEVAKALADALGDGWTYDSEHEYDHRRGCKRPDGAGLAVLNNQKRGRLSIAPDYHTAAPTFAMWAREYDCPGSITVADDRPTPAIVKDVLRRLVPGYLEALRRMKDKQFGNDRLRRLAREAADDLQEILGGEVAAYPKTDDPIIRYYANRENFGCTYGEFAVGPTETTIELHHVPNDVAQKIALLLREAEQALPLALPAQS